MRRSFLSLCALALVVAIALPAQAITYGYPDEGRHPFVGALLAKSRSGTIYATCSGALISQTVFLTAAHCAPTGTNRVQVSFDEQITQRPKAYSGTFHGDPKYNHDQADSHDIAVVVFDKAVKGLGLAKLPKADYLDSLRLTQSTRFTAVGYGGQEPTNEPGPGGDVITYTDSREYSTSSFNSLNDYWLRLSQNNAHGDGGTCYGDSGGPNFLGSELDSTHSHLLVGITVTGDALCKSTNVTYRTDTDSARAFLGRFVSLP